ncbi:MAG: DMT family transporter [Alphaproteobacteria bacterium]
MTLTQDIGAASPVDRPLRGIAYMLLSAGGFSAMSVAGKWLTADYAVAQIIFFRSLVVLLATGILIGARRDPALLRTQNWRGHFWRGLIGTLGMFFWFYSFHLLPLADAIAINFMGPVFAILLAIIFLREPAHRQHWIALGAGFAGVLVMTQPGGGTVNWIGILVALGGALTYGVSQMHVRRLGRTESPLTTVFIFSFFSLGVSVLLLPWFWRQPSALDLALMVLTGVGAFIGQMFMTKAFICAPAATVSPFHYTGLLWGVIFGNLLWDERPTPQILGGAAIIMAAGIYLAWRERPGRPM